MLRAPAVAGQFYPGSPEQLRTEVESYLQSGIEPQPAVLAVCPHAGYIYSGRVAGQVLSRVEVPRRVLLVGPNHRGLGAPVALMSSGGWQTPLGAVELDPELGQILKEHSDMVSEDSDAHRVEHSLEVQVPFLQILREDLLLTPLCISYLGLEECLELGAGIARAVRALGEPVLLLASTDMTHYESAQAAEKKDRQALERLLALDPNGLFHVVRGQGISMCGVLPTTVCLAAAIELGAQAAELVNYTNSGEVSGDYDQVVGYAGVIVK